MNDLKNYTLNGQTITIVNLKNDINGNPRYGISWLSLNLDKYESTAKTREAGLRKFRSKSMGGGFSFQSYEIQSTLDYIGSVLIK